MEKIIDWKIIRDTIDNSWFSNDPHVQEEEIDEMAIDISGKVDEVIRQEINKVLDEFDDISICDHWRIIKNGERDLFESWWWKKGSRFSRAQALRLAEALALTIEQVLGLPATPD